MAGSTQIEWPHIVLVAQTVYGEARGEGYLGKCAVAWVIRNRVEADLNSDSKPDWWGEGYQAVVMKPQQFSCWNKGDPNLRKLLDEFRPGRPQTMDGFLCLHASMSVLTGMEPDPTRGATHYHTHAVRPSWAKDQDYLSIGNHRFYRLV